MRDQPEPQPEWESIFENKYPTDIGIKRKGSQSYVGTKLPDKEGLAFLDPHASPYFRGPMSDAPTVYSLHEPLKHYRPAVPAIEEN